MTSPYFKLLKKVFVRTCHSKKHRLNLFMAILFLTIGIVANVCTPIVFKKIIDNLHFDESFIPLLLLVGYGVLWTLSHSTDSLKEIFMNTVIERSTRLLNAHLFQNLYLLPEKIYLEHKIGSIINIVNRAQKSLPIILWTISLQIVPVIVESICVSYILLKNYAFHNVIILVLTIFFFVIYTFLGTKIALKAREKTIECEKNVDSKIIDWIKNLELVRVFGKSKHAFRDYNKHLMLKEVTEIKYLTIFSGLQLGQTIMLGMGLSLMTLYLGLEVKEGNLSIGDFVLFNTYFIQFIGPVGVLGYAFKDLKKAFLEIRDVITILNQVPRPSKSLKNLEGDNFQIEFKNVSFSYDKKVVFKKLSFIIKPREIAVIIGKTGSGKSTLFKLLTRSFKPDEGNIYINGIDINSLSLYSLRSVLGIMPQDNGLIDATIEDNIVFFHEKSSFVDLEEAAKRSHIWDTIQKLPHRFRSFVGENGARLSGGEKQRICLARLFLRQPGICLFDEPTSALDETTEKHIYDNIRRFLSKSTRIIITHRSSFAHKADKVIYL